MIDLVEKKLSKIAVSSCVFGVLTWIQLIFAPVAIGLGLVAIVNIWINHERLNGYIYAAIGIALPLLGLLLLVIRFSTE